MNFPTNNKSNKKLRGAGYTISLGGESYSVTPNYIL